MININVNLVSLLIFVIISSVSLIGQTDSLSLSKQNYYKERCNKDYQAAYEIAYKLGYKYYPQNLDSSYHWYQHSYQNSSQLTNSDLLANSLQMMGLLQLKLRNYDKSLVFTEKADSILRIYPNDTISATNLYYQGIGYEYTGRPEKAMRKFLASYEISEKMGNLNTLINLDSKFGNMKKVTGDYHAAIEHFNKALKRVDKTTHAAFYWRIHLNINDLILDHPDSFSTSELSDACQLVNEFRQNVKDPQILIYYKDYYDRLHINCVLVNGSMDEINSLSLTSIQALKSQSSQEDDLMHNYTINFEIAMRQKKYKEAKKYLDAFGKRARNGVEDRNYLLKQKRFLLVKQDYKALVSVLEELQKIELELDSDNRIESISNLEGVLRAKEKEHEVEVLNKEKEILAVQTAQTRTVALGIGALALLALGFFLNARRNNKRIASKNAEISEKNNQLEQANQTKDRIFAIIGHDLRKPVIAFNGISETINYLVKKEDYSTLQQLGAEIEKDGFALQKLTDNLLNWALTQRDVMPYNPQEVNLSQKAEEIMLIFEKVAGDKNIELVNKVPKELSVFADSNSLLTILINLIDNALKYTSAGGCVEISAITNNEGSRLEVKDTGMGIAREQLNDIFLLQKDKSRKGTGGEKGTGLGLHLVNELVKLNHGKIEAVSSVGKGTTFKILLPKGKLKVAS